MYETKTLEFKTEWVQEVKISKTGTIFHSYVALYYATSQSDC